MTQEIREKLFALTDEKYRKFSSKLIPGAVEMIGVRMPLLRALAKDLAKADFRTYFEEASFDYYEEIMLKGMVIGYAKCELEESLRNIEDFLPMITNWGICDSFCAGIKVNKQNSEKIWELLTDHIDDEKEFSVRFAVVMMLMHYINEEYIDRVLESLNQIAHHAYYVNMGIAWAVSVCYVKFPEKTEAYLKDCKLDDFTFNKSIQKIIESRRVEAEPKGRLRRMKRKAAL